jgi:hypothetical protein
MTISTITNVPILWQNSLVDVQPTSQYGRDFDRAVITTNLLLQAPADQDVEFVFAAAAAPEFGPSIRVVSEVDEETQTFETIAHEQGEQAVAALVPEDERSQSLWEAVKGEASAWGRSGVRVRAGEQLVRFTTRQRINSSEDGGFELSFLAPLSVFVLQPGGSISLAVGLPRIPNRQTIVDFAVAENPPGTSLGDISERPVLGGRMFIAHYWQYDPLYRIKYRYPPLA